MKYLVINPVDTATRYTKLRLEKKKSTKSRKIEKATMPKNIME